MGFCSILRMTDDLARSARPASGRDVRSTVPHRPRQTAAPRGRADRLCKPRLSARPWPPRRMLPVWRPRLFKPPRARCRARVLPWAASPRFDGVCPPSPAADLQTTAIDAGTFITVTCMSARLPNASEIRTIPIRGNGTAVSIRVRIPANISPTRRRHSNRPAPSLNAHRRCFYRTAPRLTFRRGAMIEIGPRENMRCGMLASGLTRPAMDRANRAVVL
jgi:hypothetical protein